MPDAPLLSVQLLCVSYPALGRRLFAAPARVSAVDEVSFQVDRGETLGLVGESGCGKTTVARAILQLVQATSGTIRFDGEDLARLTPRALRRARRRIQMIFQDPYASLNPRMTVGRALAEPIRLHQLRDSEAATRARITELLDMVGLSPSYAGRYPHEFSGGQRQRIGIARALACEPDLLVCDEPVSALDVSVQAQVVNLLQDLQRSLGLTYLFIAHGLSVIQHLSSRVAVMYLGRIVEIGERRAVYADPRHPYTRALLSAVPIPDPILERARRRIVLAGDVPSPIDPPPGCRFASRCPIVLPRCRAETPALQASGTAGSRAACWRAEEIDALMPRGVAPLV
jgi:oligopeptide transport system ATP-binding protein